MLTKIRSAIVSNKEMFNQMLIVSFATIISSFLSYYFNFFVQSKFPSLEDFSNFQFLITFLTLITIIPGSIGTSITTSVSEFLGDGKKDQLTDFFLKIYLLYFILGTILSGLVYFSKSYLAKIFNISNENFFLFLATILFISLLLTPITSFLYGLLRFYSYSLVLVALIFFKIIFLSIFYQRGFGFDSIFYSFIISSFLVLFIGFILIKGSLSNSVNVRVPVSFIKKVIFLSGPLLFITIGREMLSQVDFLIIKSKFDTLTSGSYALLINLGKIYLFGSLIIVGAMLPQIASSYRTGGNYFKKLQLYLYIELMIVFIGLICFVIFPKYLIDLLILVSKAVGLNPSSFYSYYQVVDLLPVYSIFISIVILINFFTLFFISIQYVKIFYGYILALFGQFITIQYFSWDILSVIICNIIVSSILLGYLVYETRKRYQDFNYSSSV